VAGAPPPLRLARAGEYGVATGEDHYSLAALLQRYAPQPEDYRTTAAPDWIDEIDLAPSLPHLRMGTRSLNADQWLLADHLKESELALRRRLLAEQRDSVLACTSYAEAAAEETEMLVMDWLPPDAALTSDESHPLARAGSLVQEDLCLMVHHDGAWHLEGAVLCFPSLWSLADKLGQPTAMVHAPVEHYSEELSPRVDTFFDRLTPDRVVWRRNFSLWPTLLLWVPCPSLPAELDVLSWSDDGGPDLWIRSERQTLRRLPVSGAILFTIRTQVTPVSVLMSRPDRASDMAVWLTSPNGAVRRAQLGPAADSLLNWLHRILAA
jgi:hypothetical protein